jgi:hypothetical protein
LSRFVTIGAKLRGRATRTVFDSAIHQYLQCLHETAADGLQRRWYRAQFALAWPGRVSEILVDSGGVGHGVHDARTDARRVVVGTDRKRATNGLCRWRAPDQIVLCDGKGVCCWPRASPENRCDTLHPQRPPPSAVARRRGRRQVDADSARIGQGRRAGLASAAVNRRRGGGVGDRARRASPVRPGRPGGTPTERPAR